MGVEVNAVAVNAGLATKDMQWPTDKFVVALFTAIRSEISPWNRKLADTVATDAQRELLLFQWLRETLARLSYPGFRLSDLYQPSAARLEDQIAAFEGYFTMRKRTRSIEDARFSRVREALARIKDAQDRLDQLSTQRNALNDWLDPNREAYIQLIDLQAEQVKQINEGYRLGQQQAERAKELKADISRLDAAIASETQAIADDKTLLSSLKPVMEVAGTGAGSGAMRAQIERAISDVRTQIDDGHVRRRAALKRIDEYQAGLRVLGHLNEQLPLLLTDAQSLVEIQTFCKSLETEIDKKRRQLDTLKTNQDEFANFEKLKTAEIANIESATAHYASEAADRRAQLAEQSGELDALKQSAKARIRQLDESTQQLEHEAVAIRVLISEAEKWIADQLAQLPKVEQGLQRVIARLFDQVSALPLEI